MDADTKRKLQIITLLVFLAAGARTYWIFHERNAETGPEKPALKERNPDDYVYLRPSHAHDLESARAALKGKTVWVRAGNAVAFFPYAGHAVGKKEAGVLPPLGKLNVSDVVMQSTQMFAVFAFAEAEAGKAETGENAAPIGAVKHGDATIFIDDTFFLEDPHKLYDHWSAQTWAAVARHEITTGMTEAQATAAMGLGRPQSASSSADGDYGNRTLEFTDPQHADKPVTVRFANNAAVSVSK